MGVGGSSPILRHGRVLMRPRLITSKVDHLYLKVYHEWEQFFKCKLTESCCDFLFWSIFHSQHQGASLSTLVLSHSYACEVDRVEGRRQKADYDDEKAREEKEEHEEAKGRWLDNGVLEDTCLSLDGNL